MSLVSFLSLFISHYLMTPRPIITGAAHPTLRKKSLEVKKVDQKIRKIAKDLQDTLTKIPGIGLAAPQIGENYRVIIAKLNPGKEQEAKIIMVNPEIQTFSQEIEIAEEGCLSLPKIYVKVPRSKEITVVYRDLRDRQNTLHLKNLNARIVQHEIDHLDGILIVDRGAIIEEKE